MNQLNKAWLWLIIIGVISLFAVVGWEIYQVSTGGRSTFNVVVIDLPRKILMKKTLEDHFRNASDFLKLSGGEDVPVSFTN